MLIHFRVRNTQEFSRRFKYCSSFVCMDCSTVFNHDRLKEGVCFFFENFSYLSSVRFICRVYFKHKCKLAARIITAVVRL